MRFTQRRKAAPCERFFTEEPLAKDSVIVLSEEEFHHLHRVMRIKEGEGVELVNGKGQLAYCAVEKIEKKSATLQVQKVETEKKTGPRIILAQALVKLSRLEWILEKGTELGADAFWLFPADRSEKEGIREPQQRRLRQLTIAALKQCGRLTLPTLRLFPSLQGLLEEMSQKKPLALLCDPNAQASPFPSPLPHQDLILFVGPEGGFSDAEKRLAQEAGAIAVRLHPHTLRVETASLAALALATAPPCGSICLYRNNLKNRFLAASAFPQNSRLRSRLAYRQWSLVPGENFEEPPCQIPDSSGCFGIAGLGNPSSIERMYAAIVFLICSSVVPGRKYWKELCSNSFLPELHQRSALIFDRTPVQSANCKASFNPEA